MAERIEKGRGVFAFDETDSKWHREEDIDLLKQICQEGYGNTRRYKHFIIGNSKDCDYIGIPGRFLLEEQPAGGKTGFTLWQPLKGGEVYYTSLEEMDEETARKIFGYWIARIDSKTLKISEA